MQKQYLRDVLHSSEEESTWFLSSSQKCIISNSHASIDSDIPPIYGATANFFADVSVGRLQGAAIANFWETFVLIIYRDTPAQLSQMF